MDIIDKNVTFRHQYDKAGRPVIVIISSRYFPKETDIETTKRFMYWILDRCFEDMPPH